jgi:nicotinamidase-related amidase
MHVVHVKVTFRPNVPEASPRNVFLSAVKASTRHQQFFQGDSGAIHSGVAPEPNDLIVTKNRVSAFAGTDLHLLLRANDIDTLVLFGIATSGVVLSTSVDAFDADYRLIVVKDCCTDTEADLHSCLTDRFFPRIASVISADEFQTAVSTFK